MWKVRGRRVKVVWEAGRGRVWRAGGGRAEGGRRQRLASTQHPTMPHPKTHLLARLHVVHGTVPSAHVRPEARAFLEEVNGRAKVGKSHGE